MNKLDKILFRFVGIFSLALVILLILNAICPFPPHSILEKIFIGAVVGWSLSWVISISNELIKD